MRKLQVVVEIDETAGTVGTHDENLVTCVMWATLDGLIEHFDLEDAKSITGDYDWKNIPFKVLSVTDVTE